MEEAQYRTPGQLIEALLAERGWSNRVLATVLEIEETGVSKVIAAKKAVTPELAISLEEVFGIPAEPRLGQGEDRHDTKPRPGNTRQAVCGIAGGRIDSASVDQRR
jgi:ribosome-binding protein aMBF1 (putative translation factor)